MRICFRVVACVAALLHAVPAVIAAERHALLVGVSKYGHARLNDTELKYPEDDAVALASVFERSGYKVTLLLGKSATQQNVRQEVKQAQEAGDSDGVLVLGFFGHGVQYGESAYFCTFDTSLRVVRDAEDNVQRHPTGLPLQEPNPDSMVSMREVIDAMSLSPAGNKLLLADCCREDPSRARGLRSRAFGSTLRMDQIPDKCAALFACSEGEQAFELDEWKHGAFTQALLDSMAEMSLSGTVRANSLASQVYDQVGLLVKQSSAGRNTQTVNPLVNGIVDLQLDLDVEFLLKDADYSSGRAFFSGRGTEFNRGKAKIAFQKAARRGHILARVWLARDLWKGTMGSEPNVSAAKLSYQQLDPWIKKLAGQGVSDAQFHLANMYRDGILLSPNHSEAVAWYRKAAEQGDVNAQFGLGVCFANGRGAVENQQEAVKWYRKAAEQGDAESQHNLGQRYASGKGVPKSQSEAVAWYRKAAEQGYVQAQYLLGGRYITGKGVPKDQIQGLKWLRMAAESGNSRAQFNLAVCYEDGIGVSVNQSEAVRWYGKAAERGDAQAQFNLGNSYSSGKGVSENQSKAAIWFRKAAEQGLPVAQFNLGRCYAYGEGVSKDQSEAVKWYRKAAERGLATAQCTLGYRYESGDGVGKDKVEAVKWYRKAAEQGDAQAQFNLGSCYTNGTGVAKDTKEAVRWFRKAAEQGDAEARRWIARLTL